MIVSFWMETCSINLPLIEPLIDLGFFRAGETFLFVNLLSDFRAIYMGIYKFKFFIVNDL